MKVVWKKDPPKVVDPSRWKQVIMGIWEEKAKEGVTPDKAFDFEEVINANLDKPFDVDEAITNNRSRYCVMFFSKGDGVLEIDWWYENDDDNPDKDIANSLDGFRAFISYRAAMDDIDDDDDDDGEKDDAEDLKDFVQWKDEFLDDLDDWDEDEDEDDIDKDAYITDDDFVSFSKMFAKKRWEKWRLK